MRRPQIVVVGAGTFGKNHVRTFSELGSLFGVVDQNKELLSKVARDYPDTKTWIDLDKALLDITKAANTGDIAAVRASVLSGNVFTNGALAWRFLAKGNTGTC